MISSTFTPLALNYLVLYLSKHNTPKAGRLSGARQFFTVHNRTVRSAWTIPTCIVAVNFLNSTLGFCDELEVPAPHQHSGSGSICVKIICVTVSRERCSRFCYILIRTILTRDYRYENLFSKCWMWFLKHLRIRTCGMGTQPPLLL
jgi:hypothetical protein